VLAPLLGLTVYAVGTAMLRNMAAGVGDAPAPPAAPDDARTLYWCQMCSTELLLVVRGSGVAPRHCGERMHERTELPT